MRKAAELGIVFSMQPAYESQWGGENKMYQQRLGDKYKETNPFRAILDHGIRICGGSDSDTTEINYLHAIYHAVNHPVPRHRVTTMEAIRMFTSDAAYAIGKEQEKGILKAGALADVILLDGDILRAEGEALKDLQVVTTLKSGRVIYKEGRFFDAED